MKQKIKKDYNKGGITTEVYSALGDEYADEIEALRKNAKNKTRRDNTEKKKILASPTERRNEPRKRRSAWVLETMPEVSGRCITYFDCRSTSIS